MGSLLIASFCSQEETHDVVTSDGDLEPPAPARGEATSSTLGGQVLQLLLLQPIRAGLHSQREQPIGCARKKVSQSTYTGIGSVIGLTLKG